MSSTLKDIAEKLGVSRMTVSYALRDHASIPPATRARVKAAAATLGYRPNSAARSMLSGKFNTVASVFTVVDGEVVQSLRPAILAGYNRALHERDMHLTFASLDPSKLEAADGRPRILRESMVDGLLVDYDVRVADRLMTALSVLQVPYVGVNDRQDYDCIYPDEFGGAKAATERLLSLGHQKIVCFVNHRVGPLGEFHRHYSGIDRVNGYTAAVREAGLEPWVVTPEYDNDALAAQVHQLLTGPRVPTAVLCVGHLPPAIFHHVASRLGIDVPGALSVVTIHLEPLQVVVPFDTWVTPFKETGYQAVQMLLEKIQLPAERLASRAVPYASVEAGRTLGPAPLAS
jgi:LacI family transcriptional regulator